MFQLLIRIVLYVSVLLLMCFGINTAVFAESAITCHCFKDRTYNPENKFAADEYILATTFNSLVSKKFDISKRQIVMLKMKDKVSHNDLLIGLKISKITGENFDNLLQSRRRKLTWSNILKKASQNKSIQSDSVLLSIQNGVSDAAVSSEVADQLISDHFKAPLSVIKGLRLHGFAEKEISLMFLLAQVSSHTPEYIAEMYQDQKKSWSEIANIYKLEPSAAGKLILGKDEELHIR